MYNIAVTKIPPKSNPPKPLGGRHLKPQEVASTLSKCFGNATAAARTLGCLPETIREHMKKSPVVAAAAEHARETVIDIAEAKLMKALNQDEKWAILEVLHGPGRTRGYGDSPTKTPDDLPSTIINQIFLAIKSSEARGIIPAQSPTMIQAQ